VPPFCREHIHAYIPPPDHDHRTAFFSPDRFRYEATRDVYICPAGKELHFVQGQSTDRQRRYRAYVKDCNACPLKAQCTTNKQGRSLCRSVDEGYLDRVRAYQPTEPYKKALRKRSVWVEPLCWLLRISVPNKKVLMVALPVFFFVIYIPDRCR
jgi:hypothetical protein